MSSLLTTNTSLSSAQLSSADFQKVREIIHAYCGIFINEGKEALVQSRLMKRLRKLGMSSFKEYLEFIESEGKTGEFLAFVDVLTTNKTSFFRENQHFDFIIKNVLPAMEGRSAKWWSAGCSSGEEPITCAITLLEAQKEIGWKSAKILATDISRDVLHTAKQGIYREDRLSGISDSLKNRYFEKEEAGAYKVKSQIRNMITYGRLNLNDTWPLKGNFQVIMCRNVMIYFNRQTQEEIVRKFHQQLEPGGYLFLGHSESINGNNLGFANVAPAVYQKK